MAGEHYDAHLHPITNLPTNRQPSTPYIIQEIACTRFYNLWSLQQGQRSNQNYTMMLQTRTTNQCPYHISTSCTLQFLRYSPNKILQVKVTTARSKVKSRSHPDIAHPQPLTNVPTKYQLLTPYGFRDVAWTRFYMLRTLRQDQRSKQGPTMTLHTYNPQPMSLPSLYSLDKIL